MDDMEDERERMMADRNRQQMDGDRMMGGSGGTEPGESVVLEEEFDETYEPKEHEVGGECVLQCSAVQCCFVLFYFHFC